MRLFAIADLHLAISHPNKTMEVFGWHRYMERLKENWESIVQKEDLVLIAGDISWAMKLEEALIDLEWIHALPGQKVMIKGNHDYWWGPISKMRAAMPPSIHLIQNDAITLNQWSIGGTRLWDSSEYRFDSIDFSTQGEEYVKKEHKLSEEENAKIFNRELIRLEQSLKALDPKASKRIVMTHYPPIGLDLKPSKASFLLEKYQVDLCIFGHLHNVPCGHSFFGKARGIHYYFTAADYLEFKPVNIIF